MESWKNLNQTFCRAPPLLCARHSHALKVSCCRRASFYSQYRGIFGSCCQNPTHQHQSSLRAGRSNFESQESSQDRHSCRRDERDPFWGIGRSAHCISGKHELEGWYSLKESFVILVCIWFTYLRWSCLSSPQGLDDEMGVWDNLLYKWVSRNPMCPFFGWFLPVHGWLMLPES